MNAYELADQLKEYAGNNGYSHNDYADTMTQSANMLRQQADRIAELEKGEEVAGRFYWESVVDGHVMAVPSEGTPHYNKDDFPLYTTPQTKPLSDEEIDNICQEIACECQHIETDEWIYRVVARAIEERHGIK